MAHKQQLIFFAVILIMIAAGFSVGLYTARYYGDAKTTAAIEGMLWPHPKQLLPFTATDQNGKTFGLERLQGKWSLLFFGYTHCPDICPATLSLLDQVYGQLQKSNLTDVPDVPDIQVIFVSVDPERDNTKQLADYVSYFNPAFIGLGGTDEQVQSLTKQLGVVYRQSAATDTGDYLMDHSASIFLLTPAAELISVFSAPHNIETIVSRFKQIRRFIEDGA